MKRPLMYAAGGFVLGEVCLLLPVGIGAVIPVIVTAGVCYLWIRRKESGRDLLWWVLPFFVVLGMLRFYADQRQTEHLEQVAEAVCGEELRLEGDVWKINRGESASLELKDVVLYAQGEAVPYGDVIMYGSKELKEMAEAEDIEKDGYEDLGSLENLRIGMRVSVWGRLERFRQASNPGEFDYAAYYHSLGFEGRIYGDYVHIVNYNYSPYFHGVHCLKRKASDILALICTEEDFGVFQAVVLGDKSGLGDETRELYQKNGMSHILAVSGLHVSLIGLGLYHLLRKAGLDFDGAGMTAAVITFSYGVLTGGAASVVRAVMMILFQILADKLGRTYDLLSAMAFAALWLLFESPTQLFQAGFQLSFGAVLAIGAVNPVLIKWLEPEKLWEKTVLLSMAIQVVTYPMIAWHFFEYPLYGLVLNLVVIPLAGYALGSGLAGIALGAIWLKPGEFAVGTGHYVLAFYDWMCRHFQELPGAVLVVGRPKVWQIAVYGMVWSVLLWCTRSLTAKKRICIPAFGKKLILIGLILAGFGMLRPLSPKKLETVFLDVGQGDGICLQTRDTVILVDGGSTDEQQLGEQVLEPFLKSRGISRIDCAIVSHGDQDHISGLSYLLESDPGIHIEKLVLPWKGKEDESCGKLKDLAEAAGTEVYWMKSGGQIQNGMLVVRCLYAGENLSGEERNDHSLMLEANYENVSILLTGDMSAEGERQWVARDSSAELIGQYRILKVAHHGSRYSTPEEFLQKVRPEVAVISCGRDNSYGHPPAETLARLETAGSKVMETKDCGAVIVKMGKGVKLYGVKEQIRTASKKESFGTIPILWYTR